ncbi:hypothetical protein SLEP1_g18546 [Rubroshorea leprosula]|uniref:Uncharacterized protein n=1 Tax=Rubroshorea leprosula TaxID=152421 RepID=A0AAV5J8G4_9ROSI|nr:hypothetical protein SLEP1_g18546 [Rubroshorea leprosula]
MEPSAWVPTWVPWNLGAGFQARFHGTQAWVRLGTQCLGSGMGWNPGVTPGFLGTQPGQACWVRKEPSAWVGSKEPRPAGFQGEREGKGEGERERERRRKKKKKEIKR